jgi:hypothetical protein
MSDDSERPVVERRARPRRSAGPLRARLDVPRESDVLYLSSGGMMVRLDFSPELGSFHRFTLGFPDRTLELAGVVRNVDHLPGSAGEFRVGIEFEDVSPDDRAFLEAFVAERLD